MGHNDSPVCNHEKIDVSLAYLVTNVSALLDSKNLKHNIQMIGQKESQFLSSNITPSIDIAMV
jgi:hypothetical protein